MVIYEVTANVVERLIVAYVEYMTEHHIPDVLATGYFAEAWFVRSAPGRFRVHYVAHDQTSLDEYLAKEATRLRADFTQHLPEGAELSRENWDVVKFFKSG